MAKRVEILGVPIDRVDYEEALSIFDHIMKEEGCSLIVTPNSEILVNASRDKALQSIIRSAKLIIPDGIGLVYASKILGFPLTERVTGIDFLERIIGYLEKNGRSIFFLGSKPGIAEAAIEKMKEKYPKLSIAGAYHGYFKESDEHKIVETINLSGADFLCVAMGSPRQEQFIHRHQPNLKVKAAIGVGGSLDVWAGTLKRAPEFYRKNGLEWFYRFLQQPTRYKRLAALPIFMFKVLLSKRQKQ